MKYTKILATFLFCATLGTAHAEPLLGTDNFDLWTIKGPAVSWSIKDGVLTGVNDPEKKGSNLWTKKEYEDFTLKGEFKFTGIMDSGVFIRHDGDQIQFGISGSLKRDMTGSPYIAKLGKYPVEAEGVAELLKEGEWNSFTITATGNRYQVELNGSQVLDYKSDTATKKGPIGLQVHGGMEMQIEFRALEVEELKIEKEN